MDRLAEIAIATLAPQARDAAIRLCCHLLDRASEPRPPLH